MELSLSNLINVKNIKELKTFAKKLSLYLNNKKKPFFLLLTGDLGAGKTTLTKYLLDNLGVKVPVNSPSFIILNQYLGTNNLNINHMDAYRLTKNEDLGLYEELFENSLNIIEWPERLNLDWKKYPHLQLKISIVNDNERLIEMG